MTPTDEQVQLLAAELEREEFQRRADRELRRREALAGQGRERLRRERAFQGRNAEHREELAKQLRDAYGPGVARRIDLSATASYDVLHIDGLGDVLLSGSGSEERFDRLAACKREASLHGLMTEQVHAGMPASGLLNRGVRVVAVDPDRNALIRLLKKRRGARSER